VAPRLGGIKQNKLIGHSSSSLWFLLFYSPKPRSQVRIWIQLFRQRLSHTSVKAYATMPIGIMSSDEFGVDLLRFTDVYQQEKRKHKYILLVLFPSMPLTSLKRQSRTKNSITRNTFRHCRVRFCGTTFLETAVYRKWSIVLSRSLTHRINYKLMCLSAYWG